MPFDPVYIVPKYPDIGGYLSELASPIRPDLIQEMLLFFLIKYFPKLGRSIKGLLAVDK